MEKILTYIGFSALRESIKIILKYKESLLTLFSIFGIFISSWYGVIDLKIVKEYPWILNIIIFILLFLIALLITAVNLFRTENKLLTEENSVFKEKKA